MMSTPKLPHSTSADRSTKDPTACSPAEARAWRPMAATGGRGGIYVSGGRAGSFQGGSAGIGGLIL